MDRAGRGPLSKK